MLKICACNVLSSIYLYVLYAILDVVTAPSFLSTLEI